MKKKVLSALLAVTMTTISLAGCGSGGNEPANAESAASAPKQSEASVQEVSSEEAAAAEEGKDVYAFDMSKYALMKCARRHPAIHAFAASIYDLPLDEACADMVMSIFAPFGADEFLRVLKPGGYVLKVEPAHDHLLEMKQAKGTDLSRYEVIVFGGGIYASGIAGLNALKKQLAHLSPQNAIQTLQPVFKSFNE